MQPNIRFPLFIDIKNKNILVVGGGVIATRRVKTLLQFDCNITVVSILATDELQSLAKKGAITLHNREFNNTDLDEIFLATATTDNREVNYNIGQLAHKKNIYVSVADAKDESNFFFPAIATYDNAIIAIGADGTNHKIVSTLAQKIRTNNELLLNAPLKNVQVLVTSPQKSKSVILPKLQELGAVVDYLPTIEIVEIDFTLPKLDLFTWIVFTSSSGVNIFFTKFKEKQKDSRSFANNKFAVVGSQTAKTLNSYGIIPDFIPKKFNGESLIAELSNQLNKNDNVLLIRPQSNPEALCKILKEKEIPFTELSIYKTEHKASSGQVKDLKIYDYITFTSSSCVEGFYKEVTTSGCNVKDVSLAICIGEKTATTAKKYGLNTIISKVSTVDSLVETIVEHRSSSKIE